MLNDERASGELKFTALMKYSPGAPELRGRYTVSDRPLVVHTGAPR